MEILSYISEMLFRYHSCCLPGIGCWKLEYTPAAIHLREEELTPPQWEIMFTSDPDADGEAFIKYIVSRQNILEAIAQLQVEKEILLLRKELAEGKPVMIPQVGVIKKDITGEIIFAPQHPLNEGWPSIKAAPVMHKDAAPSVLVGNTTVTAGKPLEYNSPKLSAPPAKNRWLLWLIGCAIIFIIVFSIVKLFTRTPSAPQVVVTAADTLSSPPAKDSLVKAGAAHSSFATDSTAIKNKNVIAEKNDSVHFQIVFGVYQNKDKAQRQYLKMLHWGHPVVLLLDGATYYLAMNITCLPKDTTHELQKMKVLYGGEPFIKY